MESELVPELHVQFFTCLDYAGDANLIIHLVFAGPGKTRNRIFVGVSRAEYNQHYQKPQGYYLSQQTEETQETGHSGQ